MEFKAWIPLKVSFKVKGRDVIVDIQQSVSFFINSNFYMTKPTIKNKEPNYIRTLTVG